MIKKSSDNDGSERLLGVNDGEKGRNGDHQGRPEPVEGDGER
jgi:hypothetical protein